MNLVRTAAPTSWAVTLEEAKAHLRVVVDDEDADITLKMKAAQTEVEKRTGRALTEQTWTLTLDGFPAENGGRILIPRPPLIEIASFTYVDGDGAEQSLVGGDYLLVSEGEPAELYPLYGESWPTTRDIPAAVRIAFTCGASDDRPLAETLVQALLLLLGHYYENREAVVTGTISTVVDQAVSALVQDDVDRTEYRQ